MLPTRFVPNQSSVNRKSRLDARPSFLPKPRRPVSTDRLSSDGKRPSANGPRSNSAEPPRVTIAGGRLSREASATKIPINRRSRSQVESRYGQGAVTPLHSSHFQRSTATPIRTPSSDRSNRSWEASLDRVLAFVTTKDQRPITNVAWQRAVNSRVQQALAARGSDGGSMALIRPLTIARFVDITGALLSAICGDIKLNNDNYITKVPLMCKRLLYPGAMSKSWLRTVNTLHAFPQALALLAYLLDLLQRIESPVVEELVYSAKDDLSCLRRDYLLKCWNRFQSPDYQIDDLKEEYLFELKAILGTDEDKLVELQQLIKNYEVCLEDEAEAAARADEARRAERRGALAAALRAERGARAAAAAARAQARIRVGDASDELRALDLDIDRATAEIEQLRIEVERQTLSVSERGHLLDKVEYSTRVIDSKRVLVREIEKMVLAKENELALWQRKTLDSCVEYKQGLIHLSTEFPELSSLAIDEKELMDAACAERVGRAVEQLRAVAHALHERRAGAARARTAAARRRAAHGEQIRAALEEAKLAMEREQQALKAEQAKEAAAAASWAAEERQLADRLDALRARQEEYAKVDSELDFWEKQDAAWRTKLAAMDEYIESQKEDAKRALEAAKAKRVKLLMEKIALWNEKLDQKLSHGSK